MNVKIPKKLIAIIICNMKFHICKKLMHFAQKNLVYCCTTNGRAPHLKRAVVRTRTGHMTSSTCGARANPKNNNKVVCEI